MILTQKIKKSNLFSSDKSINLLEGSIARNMIAFAIPLFLGHLLQQMYNIADAYVVGNFAKQEAFAAVSSSGNIIFLIVGFFNGIAIGGSVIISKYFGANDKEHTQIAIHTCFLFGLLASIFSTIVGLMMIPYLLNWMGTPADVLPYSLTYFQIFFGGVITNIMFNICMAIMRALGDSLHPLYYLIFSSILNIVLDLIFVALFHWDVTGAATATVMTQALSVILCLIRMCTKGNPDMRLKLSMMKFNRKIMLEVISQGLPMGIQNGVISIGNVVVQSNINSFGSFAMSGHGAYTKIEGFVFLPIMSMSMALPTFISQNLGAKNYNRAKKGAAFGVITGVILSELCGVLVYTTAPYILRFFVDSEKAISFGVIHAHTVAPFFFLLSFSHCCAGVLRGCGKSFVPMIIMLMCWCGIRICYVTAALNIFHYFRTISFAYPITWCCSSIIFLIFLLKNDWVHGFEN